MAEFDDFRGRRESRVADDIETLAFGVIGAAIEVHRVLGPGLAESHYQRALSHELKLQGIAHTREEPVDIHYKGELVGEGRIDLFVAGRLVVELKTVESLTQIHRSQTLIYLQAKQLPLGLLINFNVPVLRDGIKRVINTR